MEVGDWCHHRLNKASFPKKIIRKYTISNMDRVELLVFDKNTCYCSSFSQKVFENEYEKYEGDILEDYKGIIFDMFSASYNTLIKYMVSFRDLQHQYYMDEKNTDKYDCGCKGEFNVELI